MNPYWIRYCGNEKKAILHYKQNIQLAEALLPAISIFEVALRNAVIKELERMTMRKDWCTYFASIPALKELYLYVETAKQHLSKKGKIISQDLINGELTLGFWVLLFNAKYSRYLWKDLRRAFPYLSKEKRKRRNISTPLNDIRTLRNRVFHNESISWNLCRLEALHQSIIDICSWINPALPAWISTVERFDKVMASAKLWYREVRI